MQVIGFNFTKISGERFPGYKRSSINTNIEFTNIEKEKVDILKDNEAIKLSFKFGVFYTEQKESQEFKEENALAKILIEGAITITAEKDEAKEITKSWKKKKIPQSFQVPIYNIILRKCSPKALSIEDELGLAPHLPIPQVKVQPNQE